MIKDCMQFRHAVRRVSIIGWKLLKILGQKFPVWHKYPFTQLNMVGALLSPMNSMYTRHKPLQANCVSEDLKC